MSGPFGRDAREFWKNGWSVIPLKPRSKHPAVSRWTGYCNNLPSPQTQASWLLDHPEAGIGLCLGMKLPDGRQLVAIDVDDERFVRLVRALVGPGPTKRGKRGLTFFVGLTP